MKSKKAVRFKKENQHKDYVGNHVAQGGREVSSGEGFQETDDDSPDDRAADAVEPPEYDNGKYLQADPR